MTFKGSEIALLLAAISSSLSPMAVAGADQVFLNSSAYTLEESMPWAEAIAVEGDTIIYVGDNAGARALIDDDTTVRDLQGKMLLPGFIDAHMHPVSGGAYARALSLDTFGTVEDWQQAIAEYAAANPDAPLLFGYGFLGTTFGSTGPTRQMLDAIVPDRPVLIMDEGFHGAWANSKALATLGINKDTPDPMPGFSYYKRDKDGNPTGYLLEETAGMAMEALDAITEDVIVEGTAHVLDTLNSYGVTSAYDAGVLDGGEALLPVLQRLEKNGDMSVRIIGSYRPNGPDDVADAAASADHWRDTLKGDNFHYRQLKIMLDGTVEGRTAAMFEDYQGEPGNKGELVFSEAQTTEMLLGAAQRNIDVHLHGLGERAVHVALNAIETARRSHPDSDTRYTICHIQVIGDKDLPRFAELDVIANSTPLWASHDTYGEQFVSADQFSRYWRFKSLDDSGARLTWGSDFPASGAGMLGMSPVLQMEIGHTRQNPGEPDAPVQPNPAERLSLDRLIRGYTINAAYQLHMEDSLGSLKVGKKADLVVLDSNLFELDSYAIHRASVVMTIKGGEVVYQAP
jgi:predicted amidohydrolase YtcJ